MPTLLDPDRVTEELQGLDGWSGDTEQIERLVEAPSFPLAIRLVQQVADVAEEMNHHPNIDIRWRKVTFALSTHSEGGVTDLDVELAHRIDGLARDLDREQ
jgi:4a-hydroxytetrahydrobiopterin dehydratase